MNFYLPKLTSGAEAIQSAPQSADGARKWLGTLSMVNLGDSTRNLYKTLQVLNRRSFSPKERLDIMEQVLPFSEQVLNTLSTQLKTSQLPLSSRQVQIDKLIQALLSELAVGYKHVIHDLLSQRQKPSLKLSGKQVALATHRAMRLLGQALTQHDRSYSQASDSLWHDIHRLQQFAETHKITDARVRDSSYRTIEQSTILDVYKQVCLMSLCQPFRLRLAEMDELQRFLETGVALCEIRKSLLSDDRGAVFVASLRSSEPPAYLPLADITTFSNLRGFDLGQLFAYLRQQQDGTAEPDPMLHTQLSPLLARRILHILSQQEKRRFSRVVTNRPITIALGLKNIVSAIEADTRPEMSKEELFDLSASAPQGIDPLLNPLAFNADETLSGISFDQSSLYTDFDNGSVASLPNEAPPTSAPALPDSWREWNIVNSGAAGYGLQWSNPEPCLAHVGEIVAIREKEYNIHHWRIGLVRWIKNHQPKCIDIGIQLLAPRAIIVKVDTLTPGEKTSALMLPGMKAVHQPPSFICPPGIYTTGDSLDINMLEKNLSIELTSVGEAPGTYNQFFYKAHGVRKAAVTREPFDDLWSKL